MKKIIFSICMFLSSTQAFAIEGLNLDTVNFVGECGKTSLKGVAIPTGVKEHFVGNVAVSLSGKEVFSTEDENHAIGFDYMSINCIGEEGKNKLVITGICNAHADVCGKTSYYIIDGNSGALIAPKNIKSQKNLCNSKCAEKIVGRDLINTIEKFRHE